jgi:diguanylate cyclase (GGDEF)-like protein
MGEKYSSDLTQGLGEPSSPLEKFAQKVLEKLIEDGVPPIPSNYRVYFFNMLDDEPTEFKKQVYDMISIEETNEMEKDFEIEKKLKLSFKYTKALLQHSALMYKTSNKLKEILQMQLKEVAHIASPKVMEKLIKQLEKRLQAVTAKIDMELKTIKNIYSKNVEIIKEIESKSAFDAQYGVYNRQYFLKLLQKEIQQIEKFSHISSLIVLKVKNEVLDRFSEKSKIPLNRSIAKIMLKTSRRTDIVAHVGDNIFAMLLKHTDRIGAIKTVERLADMICNSAFFLEGEEVEIKIVAGIIEIKSEKTAEEYLQKAIEIMSEAEKNNTLYLVYEGE